MHRSILALLLAAAPLAYLHAAPAAKPAPEVEWMKVTLDGRKIGHIESRVVHAGGKVTTTERLEISMDRGGGMALTMQNEETSVEREDGTPLSFAGKMSVAGVGMETSGTIGADGTVAIVSRASGGAETKRTMQWPAGAVLAHGAHVAEQQHGLAPGTSYRVLAFQPMDLAAIPIDVRIVSRGPVRLGDVVEELVEVEQRAEIPGAKLNMRAWVTPGHELRKSTLPLLGLELVMVACDEECAKAPNQTADILESTAAPAPATLTPELRREGVRYRIAVTAPDAARPPETGEQHVTGSDRELVVDVDPTPAKRDRSEPIADERGPNRWVESDDAKIVAMAKQVVDGARDDDERMKRLERHVAGYITEKSMRVGYATARQTLDSREGDCTEHAVLLAALARAAGIPARVMNGLAYAASFGGYENAFIPHAWVQAYVDGEWRSYDAALRGFDAGHIALSYGSGESIGFYAGVTQFGYLKVLDAQPLPASH